MTSTISQLVSKGLREAGIIGVGDTPEAAEYEETADRLRRIISSFFGNELGENLQTVNYGRAGLVNPYAQELDTSSEIGSIYVPSNVRLVFNINVATTLYLNPNPDDGARFGLIDNAGNFATYNVTVNGNGRQIEMLNSVLLNANDQNREWFYRADLGNWVRVTDLGDSDESPLPQEFDDYLITLLAFRVNPRYGATTSQEMITVMTDMKKRFRARYKQRVEQPSEDGITLLPSNPFGRWNTFNPQSFNRGFN